MQTEESESRFASQAFHALLRDKTRGMVVRNAGIVGGRRAVFVRALSTVVDRMQGLTEIGDMVCAALFLQACSRMPSSPQPDVPQPAAPRFPSLQLCA